MTIDELEAELEERYIENLDELVHEEFAQQAACVNNQGLRAQIEFLLESGTTPEELLEVFPQ